MKLLLSICLLLSGLINAQAQNGFALIKGSIGSLTDKDSVVLTVNQYGYPFFYSGNESHIQALKHHKFFFRIPVGKYPMHLSLEFKEKLRNESNYVRLYKLSLHNYYLESGDRIIISENKGLYSFAGKNAEKFKIIGELNKIEKKINTGLSWDNPNNAKRYFEKQDALLVKSNQYIELKRGVISTNIYLLLKADVLGHYLSRWSFLNLMPAALIETARNNLNNYHSTVPERYLDIKKFNKYAIVKFSDAYTNGLLTKYKFDSCTVSGRPYTLNKSFDYFEQNFSNGLKERLVINEIYEYRDANENLIPYVNRALGFTSIPDFKNILKKLKLTRLAGAPAFNFSLPDTSGNIRSFSEFKGKVVLLDFWFTGCGTCRLSAPYVEKLELLFKGKPVVFLTVNLDRNKDIWMKSIRGKSYTSDLSIDLFTSGDDFSHPISKYYEVDGCPAFVLIDKKGNLMVNIGNPALDNGAEITRLIEGEINR